MADQDAGGTQAEPQAAPQAGEEEGQPQAGGQQETMTLEEAKKLRREAASLRKRLEEQETAKLTEAQQLAKRNQELETQLAGLLAERQERTTREAIAAAANKAGALYPETLYRLADAGEIELDEAGNVRNATSLVNKLRQAYPALFRAVSVDGGASGKTVAAGGLNSFIRNGSG